MDTTAMEPVLLKNGLTLLFDDQSKKIAADRWYVCIWVRIKIPVDMKWFNKDGLEETQFEPIVRVLGHEVVFSHKKERNFVSSDQKNRIVQEICESAKAMAIQYCSSNDFAAKTILKKFSQHRLDR